MSGEVDSDFLIRSFGLAGRVAIVTGSSRGIGKAIAVALAKAGATVYGFSRTGVTSDGVSHVLCDVADTESVDRAVATATAASGRLDILVNAAGVSLPPGAGDSPAELARFKATLNVDLVAPYACVLATLPHLRASGGGSVVNITSINSVRAFPGNPGYVTAKAGLAGLTRALAVDLAVDKIRVNSVAPGYVATDMTRASYANPEEHSRRRRHTALDRWGDASDLVGAALFLVSPASAYVTGQEIFVDGGWTIAGLARP